MINADRAVGPPYIKVPVVDRAKGIEHIDADGSHSSRCKPVDLRQIEGSH
jgi:hypothetical protein